MLFVRRVGSAKDVDKGMAWVTLLPRRDGLMTDVHRKQCKRFDIAGEAHSLMFSCFRRWPLLGRPRSCRWMLDAFESARRRGRFELWAYVIIPEHVPVMLLPRSGERISAILTALKQPVSNRAMAWLARNRPDFLAELEAIQPNGRRHHRFWQRGGGYDRNLRSVLDIDEKIEYALHNPVRRGLVERATAWTAACCRCSRRKADKNVSEKAQPHNMPIRRRATSGHGTGPAEANATATLTSPHPSTRNLPCCVCSRFLLLCRHAFGKPRR